MPFYHLCMTRLSTGSIIEPGNFGHVVSLFGYKHNLFGREAAIERSRLAFAPDAPSRLNCVFAFLSQADALAFKFREHDGFRTSYLYEVEPVQVDAAVAVVPLDMLDNWSPNEADQRASLYWSRRHDPMDVAVPVSPGMGESAGFYEVLLGGSVRVLRRLS